MDTAEDLFMDTFLFACLAVFLILFGVLHVTNIQVDWGRTIMGFAALLAGIVCAVRASRGMRV